MKGDRHGSKIKVVVELTLAEANRLLQRSVRGSEAIAAQGPRAYEKRAGLGGSPGIAAGHRAHTKLANAIYEPGGNA